MVIKIAKMSINFWLFWTAVCYSFRVIQNNGIFVESHDVCEDESCLNENFTKSSKIENYETSSVINNTNDLLDKEVLASSEVPLNQDSKVVSTIQESTSSERQNISESTEKINLFLNNSEEHSSTTEVSKIPENISTSTTEASSTNPTTKSLPTTQTPFTTSSSKKFQKKDICFCDLQANHCDINCCCDEDCTVFHFKIFTKCIESDVTYNSRYCYRSNFIIRNNSPHEIIQTSGDLFCIVRENLIHSMNYKTDVFTTQESFNKSLPSNLYTFSYKFPEKSKFKSVNYSAGSPVWIFQNGDLTPFGIPYSSLGLLCNSRVNIKYLVDQIKICYYQQHPTTCEGNSKLEILFHYLKNLKIISNPKYINKSEILNATKICKDNVCIGINAFLCQDIDNVQNCAKITQNTKFKEISCWGTLSHVHYKFWHNGSEGIVKIEAYLWVKKLKKVSEEFFSQLITKVNYVWIGSSQVFKKSGNPGYLTGKPILAGKKVYSIINGTSDKKEAIELSTDSKDWLSVLGSQRGICSSSERIPINFRENGKFVCSLELSRNNFTKENCLELQNHIFKLLIGSNVLNEAKDNFFNQFVATFGNSKVEETGDWVQVLIDLFPITSSQASFRSNHYLVTCKNIITDLYINIIYSKIGSFLAPQAKILGVSYEFGTHKDLTYYCDTPGCENTSLVQYFKLSSAVRFVDVTKPATDAFSEPLSLEAKLPHDFFYPFFSKGVRSHVFNKLIFFVFLSVFL